MSRCWRTAVDGEARERSSTVARSDTSRCRATSRRRHWSGRGKHARVRRSPDRPSVRARRCSNGGVESTCSSQRYTARVTWTGSSTRRRTARQAPRRERDGMLVLAPAAPQMVERSSGLVANVTSGCVDGPKAPAGEGVGPRARFQGRSAPRSRRVARAARFGRCLRERRAGTSHRTHRRTATFGSAQAAAPPGAIGAAVAVAGDGDRARRGTTLRPRRWRGRGLAPGFTPVPNPGWRGP
jgi:hypothetical protein